MKSLRLATAVILGAILIGGAVGYVNLFVLLPEGNGPAGPTVSASLFQTDWTDRPVQVLGLGDSITAGFGAKPGHAFFARLIENPPDEFEDMRNVCLKTVLPNLTFQNHAVNGSTSIECLARQLPDLKAQPPEVFGIVVLTTGGNDIIHMYGRIPPVEGAMYGATVEQARPWIANYENRLDEIVAGIGRLFPGGFRIFLANIYDPSDGLGDPSKGGLPPWPDVLKILDAYNGVIARCAEKHDTVELVDIHKVFLGHGVACRQFWGPHYDSSDPHYWYFANIEDPNDRGHDAVRRVFLLKMAETLPPVLGASAVPL